MARTIFVWLLAVVTILAQQSAATFVSADSSRVSGSERIASGIWHAHSKNSYSVGNEVVQAWAYSNWEIGRLDIPAVLGNLRIGVDAGSTCDRTYDISFGAECCDKFFAIQNSPFRNSEVACFAIFLANCAKHVVPVGPDCSVDSVSSFSCKVKRFHTVIIYDQINISKENC